MAEAPLEQNVQRPLEVLEDLAHLVSGFGWGLANLYACCFECFLFRGGGTG